MRFRLQQVTPLASGGPFDRMSPLGFNPMNRLFYPSFFRLASSQARRVQRLRGMCQYSCN